MKRVLNITARHDGTTAKVKIEVECKKDESDRWAFSPRFLAAKVLHGLASGVMEAIRDADYFKVPLSQQHVGR